jgi:hypothetical protein
MYSYNKDAGMCRVGLALNKSYRVSKSAFFLNEYRNWMNLKLKFYFSSAFIALPTMYSAGQMLGKEFETRNKLEMILVNS